MLSFFEYIATSRRMALPDAHTMLGQAGVPLASPGKEETQRLLNRDRKQHPAGKAHKTIVPLDGQHLTKVGKRF